MRVKLYKDNSVEIDLEGIIQGLNKRLSKITFSIGDAIFSIQTSFLKYPDTYQNLLQDLKNDAEQADLSICSTKIPYENNFFFEYSGNIVILSFYSWEQLTSLPQNNGLVYFIASLLGGNLELGEAHDDTTGCINDFLWNKSAVDVGMRSGFICPTCRQTFNDSNPSPEDHEILNSIELILNDLSSASRQQMDVVHYWRSKVIDDQFDVFLCHNSQDKAEIKDINRDLKNRDIRTWLDEEQLRPGLAWQVTLEEQIASIKSAAVFVGSSGIGPWHNMELRAFLSEFVRRQCPVIPVILPSAGQVPRLPIFLRQLTWVDFRKDPDKAMKRLIWGITGNRPD